MHEGPGMNFLPGDPTARLPEWLRSEVASPGAGDDPAGRLADRLAEEMSDAWERGERPRVEDFLERHPGLAGCRAAVVRLVYEEICLHEELRAGSCSQVIDRFPQWHQELAALRECHRWIGPVHAAMDLPEVGESLAGYRLQAVLGRGLLGCVFRATQPELADRQVVLKVTPRTGGEHLSLARLQHPNIVPLYAVHDVPERGLRALCMPYLGGTTLGHLLAALAGIPPERRSGGDLLRARNEASPEDAAPPARGASIRSLGEDTYVRALCRIGVGLAEALQHAHRRGLVHLDLKPSNVLIAEDGRPMLLDFHLARGPIRPGEAPPPDLGGTPGYMAPEQGVAMERVRELRPVLVAVDERADLFSLGAMLYEALSGELPPEFAASARRLPRVSIGLADILARCLAREPSDRYADAASLAADLRRHLEDLPLRGVANRSPVERWRKWLRRHAQVPAPAVLSLASLAATLIAGAIVWGHVAHRRRDASAALDEASALLRDGRPSAAARALGRGIDAARSIPFAGDLTAELRGRLRRAHRAEMAIRLNDVVGRLRLLPASAIAPAADLRPIAERCRELWDSRRCILDPDGAPVVAEVERTIRSDLRELAILWADLRVRLAEARDIEGARRAALRIFDEAGALLGPDPIFYNERRALHLALGQEDQARLAARLMEESPPKMSWEYYALGRSLQRGGELARAAAALERAVELDPHDLGTRLALGLCAYQLGRLDRAVVVFETCIALDPSLAGSYASRALALAGLGRQDEALSDCDQALTLTPTLPESALNRGLILRRLGRPDEAAAALEQALRHGAPPSEVLYGLALLRSDRGDEEGARTQWLKALDADPAHRAASALLGRLRTPPLNARARHPAAPNADAGVAVHKSR